jgi:hypothetical protein
MLRLCEEPGGMARRHFSWPTGIPRSAAAGHSTGYFVTSPTGQDGGLFQGAPVALNATGAG